MEHIANLPDQVAMARRAPGWPLVVVTLLSVAVALVSYRYLVPSMSPPDIIGANAFREPWLLVHVVSAATALLLGPAQFFARLRVRFPALHRWTGRAYVFGCVAGGTSGLVLAFGASTGIVSTVGFGALALAWLFSTAMAWRRAVQRRLPEHRRWMIRSFALTLAAVTLRIYLPLGGLVPIPFDISYRAISFLCWVPNLLLAEWYLRRPQHLA